MEQLNDTTYSIPGLGDRMTAPVITLGGNDAKKFAPNLNIGYDFGGGEEYFDNLNRTDKIITGKSEIKHDGKRVSIIEGSDIDEIYTDDQGRMKWDVVFEKCPESFVLEWRRTCSDGLTAYYQDVLTEEEIREGAYRPDDVIGSYAIYCDKAHNWIRPLDRKKAVPADWQAQRAAGAELGDLNISAYREYKTGKVGHRYRPYVIDADGKTAWCTLLIIGNIERVTLPKDFMLSAKYPVTLDPTIGYTSAGASLFQADSSTIARGSLYLPRTAESGESVTALYFHGRATNDGDHANLGVYTISEGMLDSLIGSSTQVEVSINGGTSTWWHTDVDTALTSGVTYGIAVAWNNATGYIHMSYDSGSGTNRTYNSYAYLSGTWSSGGTGSTRYSIYADTTISSGGHPTASRFRGMHRNNSVRYA
jgi:hypothetical protein